MCVRACVGGYVCVCVGCVCLGVCVCVWEEGVGNMGN